jgi:hypothetical protein
VLEKDIHMRTKNIYDNLIFSYKIVIIRLYLAVYTNSFRITDINTIKFYENKSIRYQKKKFYEISRLTPKIKVFFFLIFLIFHYFIIK